MAKLNRENPEVDSGCTMMYMDLVADQLGAAFFQLVQKQAARKILIPSFLALPRNIGKKATSE